MGPVQPSNDSETATALCGSLTTCSYTGKMHSDSESPQLPVPLPLCQCSGLTLEGALPVAGHCHSHCTVTGILLILRFAVSESRESCAIFMSRQRRGTHRRARAFPGLLAAASVPKYSAHWPLPARSCQCDGPLGSRLLPGLRLVAHSSHVVHAACQ
jgi:hypothetical protein